MVKNFVCAGHSCIIRKACHDIHDHISLDDLTIWGVVDDDQDVTSA